MFICKYSIFFLFISFTFGAKPNLDTIKKTEGFESTFYTKDSGLPYLSISYKSATSQRPKIGFLKFGISFLEIENLKIRLDLHSSPPGHLLSMWQNLMTQKAIRYATMEPIQLDLVDRDGKLFNVKASKGKFTSSGELRMWGKVICSREQDKDEFERVSIVYDASLNALSLVRGSNDPNPMLLIFEHS